MRNGVNDINIDEKALAGLAHLSKKEIQKIVAEKFEYFSSLIKYSKNSGLKMAPFQPQNGEEGTFACGLGEEGNDLFGKFMEGKIEFSDIPEEYFEPKYLYYWLPWLIEKDNDVLGPIIDHELEHAESSDYGDMLFNSREAAQHGLPVTSVGMFFNAFEDIYMGKKQIAKGRAKRLGVQNLYKDMFTTTGTVDARGKLSKLDQFANKVLHYWLSKEFPQTFDTNYVVDEDVQEEFDQFIEHLDEIVDTTIDNKERLKKKNETLWPIIDRLGKKDMDRLQRQRIKQQIQKEHMEQQQQQIQKAQENTQGQLQDALNKQEGNNGAEQEGVKEVREGTQENIKDTLNQQEGNKRGENNSNNKGQGEGQENKESEGKGNSEGNNGDNEQENNSGEGNNESKNGENKDQKSNSGGKQNQQGNNSSGGDNESEGGEKQEQNDGSDSGEKEKKQENKQENMGNMPGMNGQSGQENQSEESQSSQGSNQGGQESNGQNSSGSQSNNQGSNEGGKESDGQSSSESQSNNQGSNEGGQQSNGQNPSESQSNNQGGSEGNNQLNNQGSQNSQSSNSHSSSGSSSDSPQSSSSQGGDKPMEDGSNGLGISESELEKEIEDRLQNMSEEEKNQMMEQIKKDVDAENLKEHGDDLRMQKKLLDNKENNQDSQDKQLDGKDSKQEEKERKEQEKRQQKELEEMQKQWEDIEKAVEKRQKDLDSEKKIREYMDRLEEMTHEKDLSQMEGVEKEYENLKKQADKLESEDIKQQLKDKLDAMKEYLKKKERDYEKELAKSGFSREEEYLYKRYMKIEKEMDKSVDKFIKKLETDIPKLKEYHLEGGFSSGRVTDMNEAGRKVRLKQRGEKLYSRYEEKESLEVNLGICLSVDVSGSMSYNMGETMKLVIFLGLLCQKWGIPFHVNTFGDSLHIIKDTDDEFEERKGTLMRELVADAGWTNIGLSVQKDLEVIKEVEKTHPDTVFLPIFISDGASNRGILGRDLIELMKGFNGLSTMVGIGVSEYDLKQWYPDSTIISLDSSSEIMTTLLKELRHFFKKHKSKIFKAVTE